MAEPKELVELGKRFSDDMRRAILELGRLGQHATLFRGMLAEHGAVEAARRVVLASEPEPVLSRLHELGRLELSVELWVLLPWYQPLFAVEVRRQAELRLRRLQVDVWAERDRLVRRLGSKI
ncbi:hypothetical protein [Amycolatopsis nigrescens]|uniref:hypothetical protein n=1 Tax=Amycolatopsis nigrescens TaxID=381445 RepID=UPI00035C4D33|nr:hypothetical protein [Amycolatopsis nigrescens]